jgi:hypothetical protein
LRKTGHTITVFTPSHLTLLPYSTVDEHLGHLTRPRQRWGRRIAVVLRYFVAVRLAKTPCCVRGPRDAVGSAGFLTEAFLFHQSFSELCQSVSGSELFFPLAVECDFH